MSYLEKLINELCNNSIKYQLIKELAEVGTGSSNGNEAQEDGSYPFFIRSQTVKCKDDWEYDEEAIIIPGEGGIGEIYHYVNGKYAIHQRVYRIHFIDDSVNVKFAFYYFRAYFKQFIIRKAVSATVKSIRKPMIEDFSIPIPPLEIQKKIIRILDTFTELTTKLTIELTARKKQYNYYRNQLLSFKEGEFEWKTLGKVATITIGEFVHQNKQDKSAKYPVYNGGVLPTGYYNKFNNTGDKIIVSARGANAGFVNCISKPYWAGNSCYSIGIKDSSNLKWEFVYYFLKENENNLIGSQQKGSIPAVSKKQMEFFQIPIPSPAIQEEIVRILDTFTKLTAELTAELIAREKQYEYYRNMLLSFPKENLKA